MADPGAAPGAGRSPEASWRIEVEAEEGCFAIDVWKGDEAFRLNVFDTFDEADAYRRIVTEIFQRGDAAGVSAAPSGEKFDWQNLREVLCNVSQIFNGWRADDCWSRWDEEVAQAVVAIQRHIDVAPVELQPPAPEGKI